MSTTTTRPATGRLMNLPGQTARGRGAAGPQRHVHGPPRVPPRPGPLRRRRAADAGRGRRRVAGAGGPVGAVRRGPAPPPHHRGRRAVAAAARRSPTPRAGRRSRRWRPSTRLIDPMLAACAAGFAAMAQAPRRRDPRPAGRHHRDRPRHPVRPHGARGDATRCRWCRSCCRPRAGSGSRRRPAPARASRTWSSSRRGSPTASPASSSTPSSASIGKPFEWLVAMTRGRYAARRGGGLPLRAERAGRLSRGRRGTCR